ncbi:hypothetical protein Zmor_013342 [Zophobas morio]|uniref:Odorant receptor n=1 Tax=Zophobas morio TaxID=2755281 RepID=A0AA38IDV9_9CUCU|nr:hypothetical protein Zmor_013342 [Zophobas morio]
MFPKERQRGEEPIKFYQMMDGNILQLPFVRLCRVCIILYYSLLFLTQTILFLYKFESLYFAQYSCSYFFSLIMLTYVVLLPVGAHTVQSFMEEVRWLKTGSAGEAVDKIIKRESFQSMIIMAFFVRVFSPVVAFGQFLYSFYNSKFQLYMLLYFIKNINEKSSVDQWRIEQRLMFCFRNHINLSKAIRKMLKKIEVVSFAYQALILVWTISFATYVLLFQDDLLQQKFRFVSVSIFCLFEMVILFHVGQNTEEIVTKVFESLVSIDWYDWNESNKKIYLMFLVSALKPFRIQFSENFSLNYNMAGQLLQSIASVVLVVYQLNFM